MSIISRAIWRLFTYVRVSHLAVSRLCPRRKQRRTSSWKSSMSHSESLLFLGQRLTGWSWTLWVGRSRIRWALGFLTFPWQAVQWQSLLPVSWESRAGKLLYIKPIPALEKKDCILSLHKHHAYGIPHDGSQPSPALGDLCKNGKNIFVLPGIWKKLTLIFPANCIIEFITLIIHCFAAFSWSLNWLL